MYVMYVIPHISNRILDFFLRITRIAQAYEMQHDNKLKC